MKWLGAGLIFVNHATVCALLLGIACGGLGTRTALVALCLGGVAAFFAYQTICDPDVTAEPVKKGSRRSQGKPEKVVTAPVTSRRYKSIWFWLLALCFAMFAIRSFCWLLFSEGDQLKIQSTNNLGDIALHITYIRNFANGVALWPENPIYVFSSVRYPAGIDLFNALLVLVRVDLRHGLIWVGLLTSLATFYAFWRWAGSFGVAGFLFNGGLVGFQIFTTRTWSDFQGESWIAWKSIPLAMFVTQRGLLYAIPAGVLLLYQWRAKFFKRDDQSTTDSSQAPLPFWLECSLYASMPLFHLHTFLALSIALAFWFLIGNSNVRRQLLLLFGCALVPATYFVWLITDHFQASSILAFKPGWVQPASPNNEFGRPFFEFWFVNFGIWIPLVILLAGTCLWRFWKDKERSTLTLPTNLAFIIPAAAIFLLACFVKTAPWEWDNTKIIIWSYFMILPFLWEDLIARWPEAVRAGLCVMLFGSGFVSLFGGLAASGYNFATRSEIDGVAVGLRKLPVEARFAAFPTYNHPLLLNGRKVVLGYPGHLWTQGFNYTKVNNQLTSLMNGAPNWRQIASELNARYLFWGREEKGNYTTSAHPWEQQMTPVASGSWGAIYDLEPNAPTVSKGQTN